ncbi:hypothetical protein RFI_38697 [Reticulomyxa filosa]|uniref:Uncharacterized protein n=1 Tax=Reticulomyxa filosa TaxID=46433 RepID=X6L9S9_RETFI|nr:hypothetical protein RFI_38697 [Reticulomyxa filosa]|eukprot:ETN98792.1 hypothetical protein RFI_38697 [Reticulomyxa filosa]
MCTFATKELASEFFHFLHYKKSKKTMWEQPLAEKVVQTCTTLKKQYSNTLLNDGTEPSQVSTVSTNDESLEHKNSDDYKTQKKEIVSSIFNSFFVLHMSFDAGEFFKKKDEKASAILHRAKPNIFFKTRQSLVDLINEQHISTCFQNDSQWKNDPNILDNEKYCQLFFAFNLKFKLYLAFMLTLADVPWILGKIDPTIDNILLKTIKLNSFYICNYD